jgi:hypothetical protein
MLDTHEKEKAMAKLALVICCGLLATAGMAMAESPATTSAPPFGAAATCSAAAPLAALPAAAAVPLYNMNMCGTCSYSTCLYAVPGARCTRNGIAGYCVAPGGQSCTQYPFLFCDCYYAN